jgi:hypothetical protein
MWTRTGKIGLSVRSPGNAKYLQARRVAWLAALLVAAVLAEGGLAAVASPSVARSSGGRQQIFRVGRLAPSRAG